MSLCVGLGGTLVALGALAVTIWRAGLTCGGLGGTLVALEPSAVAICRAGLTCGGLGGTLVALGASAVAICKAFCHEELKETSGRRIKRRIMRRSGFAIAF